MKPVACFKIWPSAGLSYQVNVWKSRKDMYKHADWIKGKNYSALCSTWRSSKDKTICGQINLNVKECRPGIIVHELTHALIGWSIRKKLKNVYSKAHGLMRHDCDEEKLCHAMGTMTAQMFKAMWKYKVWR